MTTVPRPWWRTRELALALGSAALALWVYRRAPGGFFSPDDLLYLERARGLLPSYPSLWRALSGRWYFAAAVPLFGSSPVPYLLVSWCLHGVNAALLFAWARRRGAGALGATLAAGLFGASRLFVTVVSQAATLSELLGMSLSLGAMLAAESPGAVGLAGALLLFSAALLSKESVLLLPLLLLIPGPRAAPLRTRLIRAGALLGLSAIWTLYLRTPGVAAVYGGGAYEMAFGANLLRNLAVYAAWSVDLASLIPDLASGVSGAAAAAGALVFAGLAMVAWRSRRTTTAPATGLALWLLALAPVLPLLHHSYLHYLYLPLAGLSLTIGASVEGLADRFAHGRVAAGGLRPATPARTHAKASRSPGRRSSGRPTAPVSGRRLAVGATWAAAALALGAYALHSDSLLARRAALRMRGIDLPYDPFARKSEMARRAAVDVEGAVAGRHVRAAFYLPLGTEQRFSVLGGGPAAESTGAAPRGYILWDVLDQGRALRALEPGIDSVALFSRWRPALRDFELFMNRLDGSMIAFGRGADAHAGLASTLLRGGLARQARDHLAAVLEDEPDEPRLRYLYATALLSSGDSVAARRELDELSRGESRDSIAILAREARRRIGVPPGERPRAGKPE